MVLEQRALTIVIVNSVFLGLSTITLALRCFVRLRREAFGLDDWMIVLGWLMFVVNVSMSTLASYNGLGVHNLTATAADMKHAIKYFTVFQLFTLTGTLPVKASICISLMRITPNPTYKKILYAIIVASVVVILVADLIIGFSCRPIAFKWDKTIPHGRCSKPDAILALSYIFSGMKITTDLCTAILPILIVRNLQLSLRLKISISVLLGMGVFASLATIARAKYFHKYAAKADYLYGIAPIAWWSTIELGLGIIAACLSTLRPLLRYALGDGDIKPLYNRHNPPSIGTARHMGYMKTRAIKLRNMKDGLASTIVTANGNNDDKEDEGDKSSQKGILHGIPGGSGASQSPDIEKKILVTQSYRIEKEEVGDSDVGAGTHHSEGELKYNTSHESRERKIKDIV